MRIETKSQDQQTKGRMMSRDGSRRLLYLLASASVTAGYRPMVHRRRRRPMRYRSVQAFAPAGETRRPSPVTLSSHRSTWPACGWMRATDRSVNSTAPSKVTYRSQHDRN